MNSPNQSDIVALQRGLKNRAPARNGLRLYTGDFDSISLGGFYKGRSAFLVLSGPSLNDIDLTLLDRRGIVTMGVNNSWTVHRPTLWTCVDDPGRFIDTGWKDPGVLKFVPVCHWGRKLRIQAKDGTMRDSAYRVAQMPSVLFFRRSNHFDHERFLTGDTVPWGNDPKSTDSLGIKGKRSVMLVALRLLHHLGFRTVYLLGCDFRMAADHKYAFDETREAAAIKHNNVLYDSLMGAVPCHPALWHCVRDLAHSILVYRGIWDQTGPGYLTRVINEHAHFRDVVPYHWGLFEQSETDAREHGGAFLYNASIQTPEAVA